MASIKLQRKFLAIKLHGKVPLHPTLTKSQHKNYKFIPTPPNENGEKHTSTWRQANPDLNREHMKRDLNQPQHQL